MLFRSVKGTLIQRLREFVWVGGCVTTPATWASPHWRRGRSSDQSLPFVEWLASRIPCSGDGGGDAAGGHKVMFLGPTGVGKTTTIAKLAAVQALLEHRNVLLLTSDTYRIAAVDQLRTYAKILGVPLEVVFGADSFPSVLDGQGEVVV